MYRQTASNRRVGTYLREGARICLVNNRADAQGRSIRTYLTPAQFMGHLK